MWENYRERMLDINPALRNDDAKMTIRVGEFLRQMRIAYERGESDLRNTQEAAKKAENISVPNFMREIFGDHFGM